jgi:hypothetical protein
MNIWAKIKAWLTVHSDFMNSVVFLAAMAHVGWGALIVLVPQFVLGIDLRLGVWTSVFLTAFAIGKEFFWDSNFEKNPPQTFKDNAQDFCGYLGGIALAWGLIGLALHFHSRGAESMAASPFDDVAWTVFLLGG